MKMRTLTLVIIILAAASCSKSVSGPAGMQFQLKAVNTTSNLLARTDAATIQWTSGTATPTSVKLEAKKGSAEVEYTVTAGQTVNLFQLTQQTFGNITLPEGVYNEVELKIMVNGTTAAPALELTGSYTRNNGTTAPVIFRITTPVLIKTEKHNVQINGGNLTAVTEMNLAAYTTGITQSMLQAASTTNGAIVISSVSNADLYNRILANIDRFHHAGFHHY